MVITIGKINRKEVISKKNNKPYQSLGIAPIEDDLIDINGDSFKREDRWISGFGKVGITDGWEEGDRVKVNIVRVKGKRKDGTEGEFLNFRLPEGVEPMVEKFKITGDAHAIDPNDF